MQMDGTEFTSDLGHTMFLPTPLLRRDTVTAGKIRAMSMTWLGAMSNPSSPSNEGGAPKPSVLFLCVHNAGRSQMAAGWLTALAGDVVEVRSAVTAPADQVNPVAVEAMREVDIDITTAAPKVLTLDAVEASDVVITMGCGDTCPILPATRYLDWPLDDPAGQGIETVRPIRDDIKRRVEHLVDELLTDRATAYPGP